MIYAANFGISQGISHNHASSSVQLLDGDCDGTVGTADSASRSLGNFALHRKQIREGAIPAFRPNACPIAGIDELGVDAHLILFALDHTPHHVIHPESSTDLARISGFLGDAHCRVRSDNVNVPKAGEVRNDVLGHTGREPRRCLVIGDSLERNDGHGRFLRDIAIGLQEVPSGKTCTGYKQTSTAVRGQEARQGER